MLCCFGAPTEDRAELHTNVKWHQAKEHERTSQVSSVAQGTTSHLPGANGIPVVRAVTNSATAKTAVNHASQTGQWFGFVRSALRPAPAIQQVPVQQQQEACIVGYFTGSDSSRLRSLSLPRTTPTSTCNDLHVSSGTLPGTSVLLPTMPRAILKVLSSERIACMHPRMLEQLLGVLCSTGLPLPSSTSLDNGRFSPSSSHLHTTTCGDGRPDSRGSVGSIGSAGSGPIPLSMSAVRAAAEAAAAAWWDSQPNSVSPKQHADRASAPAAPHLSLSQEPTTQANATHLFVQPVLLNAAAHEALSCTTLIEFANELRRGMARDAALAAALAEVASCVSPSSSQSGMHAPSFNRTMPGGATEEANRLLVREQLVHSGSHLVRIQACYFQGDDGALEPALILEYCPSPLHLHSGSETGDAGPPVKAAAAGSLVHGGQRTTAWLEGAAGAAPGAAASAGGGAAPQPPGALSIDPITALAALRTSGGGTDPAAGGVLTLAGWEGLGDPRDLIRGHALMSEVPVLATLMEAGQGGKVLYQNEGSRRYWGELCGNGNAEAVAESKTVLLSLFRARRDLMDDMLADLELGFNWRKVLPVPSSMASEPTMSTAPSCRPSASHQAVVAPAVVQQQQQQQPATAKAGPVVPALKRRSAEIADPLPAAADVSGQGRLTVEAHPHVSSDNTVSEILYGSGANTARSALKGGAPVRSALRGARLSAPEAETGASTAANASPSGKGGSADSTVHPNVTSRGVSFRLTARFDTSDSAALSVEQVAAAVAAAAQYRRSNDLDDDAVEVGAGNARMPRVLSDQHLPSHLSVAHSHAGSRPDPDASHHHHHHQSSSSNVFFSPAGASLGSAGPSGPGLMSAGPSGNYLSLVERSQRSITSRFPPGVSPAAAAAAASGAAGSSGGGSPGIMSRDMSLARSSNNVVSRAGMAVEPSSRVMHLISRTNTLANTTASSSARESNAARDGVLSVVDRAHSHSALGPRGASGAATSAGTSAGDAQFARSSHPSHMPLSSAESSAHDGHYFYGQPQAHLLPPPGGSHRVQQAHRLNSSSLSPRSPSVSLPAGVTPLSTADTVARGHYADGSVRSGISLSSSGAPPRPLIATQLAPQVSVVFEENSGLEGTLGLSTATSTPSRAAMASAATAGTSSGAGGAITLLSSINHAEASEATATTAFLSSTGAVVAGETSSQQQPHGSAELTGDAGLLRSLSMQRTRPAENADAEQQPDQQQPQTLAHGLPLPSEPAESMHKRAWGHRSTVGVAAGADGDDDDDEEREGDEGVLDDDVANMADVEDDGEEVGEEGEGKEPAVRRGAAPGGAAGGVCWHELQAVPLLDPVTGRQVVLLLQTDITGRAELEARMAALTETQLTMLEQMFPRHVLEYMVSQDVHAAGGGSMAQLAQSHADVTILFTDIVGFTTMSKMVEPSQVMNYLNDLFTVFDELVDQYQIYKVETAGDCYIAAGGLMVSDEDGFTAVDRAADPAEAAARVMTFAKALLRCARTVPMPHNAQPTCIRVGIHTGPLVTGLIGTKLPKFSLFGDTMNTASRMESTCKAGCIQVSAATYALLSDHPFQETGGIEIKGKGVMNTYIYDPEVFPDDAAGNEDEAAWDMLALMRFVNGSVGEDGLHHASNSRALRHTETDASRTTGGATSRAVSPWEEPGAAAAPGAAPGHSSAARRTSASMHRRASATQASALLGATAVLSGAPLQDGMALAGGSGGVVGGEGAGSGVALTAALLEHFYSSADNSNPGQQQQAGAAGGRHTLPGAISSTEPSRNASANSRASGTSSARGRTLQSQGSARSVLSAVSAVSAVTGRRHPLLGMLLSRSRPSSANPGAARASATGTGAVPHRISATGTGPLPHRISATGSVVQAMGAGAAGGTGSGGDHVQLAGAHQSRTRRSSVLAAAAAAAVALLERPDSTLGMAGLTDLSSRSAKGGEDTAQALLNRMASMHALLQPGGAAGASGKTPVRGVRPRIIKRSVTFSALMKSVSAASHESGASRATSHGTSQGAASSHAGADAVFADGSSGVPSTAADGGASGDTAAPVTPTAAALRQMMSMKGLAVAGVGPTGRRSSALELFRPSTQVPASPPLDAMNSGDLGALLGDGPHSPVVAGLQQRPSVELGLPAAAGPPASSSNTVHAMMQLLKEAHNTTAAAAASSRKMSHSGSTGRYRAEPGPAQQQGAAGGQAGSRGPSLSGTQVGSRGPSGSGTQASSRGPSGSGTQAGSRGPSGSGTQAASRGASGSGTQISSAGQHVLLL